MNDYKIKSAQKIINVASIVRMCMIAGMAFLWAFRYADEHENIVRVYRGVDSLIAVVFGFIVDMIMTVKWIQRPESHTAHMILYILFGGLVYTQYVTDYFNEAELIGVGMYFIGVLFFAFMIWAVGLIPFIICGIGRHDLTKAKTEQEQVT